MKSKIILLAVYI